MRTPSVRVSAVSADLCRTVFRGGTPLRRNPFIHADPLRGGAPCYAPEPPGGLEVPSSNLGAPIEKAQHLRGFRVLLVVLLGDRMVAVAADPDGLLTTRVRIDCVRPPAGCPRDL